MCSLNAFEQGDGNYFQLKRNQIQLSSVGVVFIGEESSIHKHLQGYHDGHFLYPLSSFAYGPEEGFVIPVNCHLRKYLPVPWV